MLDPPTRPPTPKTLASPHNDQHNEWPRGQSRLRGVGGVASGGGGVIGGGVAGEAAKGVMTCLQVLVLSVAYFRPCSLKMYPVCACAHTH